VQRRDSLTQLLPYGTVEAWYAGMEEPLETAVDQGVVQEKLD
jgi:hypothetical protein